jgi:signal transduction histidine kinase
MVPIRAGLGLLRWLARRLITAAAQTGQGIHNLRDRVKAMGGELVFESVIGEGTTIKIALPL